MEQQGGKERRGAPLSVHNTPTRLPLTALRLTVRAMESQPLGDQGDRRHEGHGPGCKGYYSPRLENGGPTVGQGDVQIRGLREGNLKGFLSRKKLSQKD